MADDIKEFSRDEASSLIYHGTPTQTLNTSERQAMAMPSAPVAPPKLSAPSKGKTSVDIPDPTKLVDTISQANKQLKEQTPAPEAPSAIGGLVDQITSNWKPMAIAAAATYGAVKATPYVKQGVEKAVETGKRLMTRNAGPAIESIKIEPTFASDVEMRQAELSAQKPTPTLTPIENLQQRTADLTAAVQAQKVPPVIPNVETALATGGNVDQAIKQTVAKELDQAVGVSPEILKTGTGREVVAGQGAVPQRFAKEYKSPADVPKGYAFVPGAQYIDVLRNDLGQGTYTQQFTGKDFPGTYPEAVETGKTINRELNRPTREQLKAQGAALPETTEGIVRKVGPSKMVKVGGVAGALVALSDLAKAEDMQQRREAVGNALLGLLPPGMDVNSLNANEAAQLQQLFAQQAYAQKVGGGRGVAPPSAYPQGGLNYNSPRIR